MEKSIKRKTKASEEAYFHAEETEAIKEAHDHPEALAQKLKEEHERHEALKKGKTDE